ncbi:hypothetical protein HOLDEFILI_01401 [Holdemania filiformis DSM 12042]|uniref:Uncharacterized protein n=1 Tax=Holdemania filiformis DSM 12042 TaxID=545696 RepID=B9Y6G9_9FIRM|nr:hypothetical protein HOLDEFILI_01401 [Holdemania filiformis DSM 12042]
MLNAGDLCQSFIRKLPKPLQSQKAVNTGNLKVQRDSSSSSLFMRDSARPRQGSCAKPLMFFFLFPIRFQAAAEPLSFMKLLSQNILLSMNKKAIFAGCNC